MLCKAKHCQNIVKPEDEFCCSSHEDIQRERDVYRREKERKITVARDRMMKSIQAYVKLVEEYAK